MTTLISGGTIVSAVGRRSGDVLIDGESITAILAPGQAAALGIEADATASQVSFPHWLEEVARVWW